MEQVLISRKELSERWGVTVRTIINYEENGLITRNPHFDKPMYYLEEIQKIDRYKANPLSHFERKRLEKENRDLKERLNLFQNILTKIISVGSESMNLLTSLRVEERGINEIDI
ncbi:transcription factor [Clostridium sp. DSM 100503]|uniref:MerR family transcriptional regulator n=1 Tax=Clostridium sp. DSM 100503 TaxID=2963282 RepID=UPI00214A23F3|nr:transcription factor [Clostridium sp. DSM 100503]MCR1952356.1 transcription factor [Clostridium sp. DSM 100503]